eukprot:311239-Prorocentrum_minimum.AAC.1
MALARLVPVTSICPLVSHHWARLMRKRLAPLKGRPPPFSSRAEHADHRQTRCNPPPLTNAIDPLRR